MGRPVGDEVGITLVELVLSMALSLLVAVALYAVVNSSDTAASNIGAAASNAQDAHNVLQALDDNLRYAAGAWVCSPSGGTWTGSSCSDAASGSSMAPTPACAYTGPATTNTNVTGMCSSSALVSESLTGTCTYWTLSSPYLVETSGTASTDVEPGVTATTGNGFSIPPNINGLVQVDLLVNAAAYRNAAPLSAKAAVTSSANAVAVHQLIAPEDLAAANAGALAQCQP